MTKQQQQIEQARLTKQRKQEKKNARIVKKRAERFVCKRYSIKFANNIKLHVHVRERHIKRATSNSFFLFIFF